MPMTAENIETPPTGSIVAAALFYAQRGFTVFPAPVGTKKSHKSMKFSKTQWGATSDAAQIIRDWDKWPDANIGLPTGSHTGFFVLEADTLAGHAVDGIASLEELQKKYGPLPATRIARSPSGSMHYYFINPPNTKIKNSASAVAPGVDVRGEGGMVIAPPSVKPNVGTYEWVSFAPIAEAPSWLLELCKNVRTLKVVKRNKNNDDIETVLKAISFIRNDDDNWENWNTTGMAIFAATGGTDEGFRAFDEWSSKSDKYNADDVVERWSNYTAHPPSHTGADTLFWLASRADPTWRGDSESGVNLVDFVSYMPAHQYIFMPTGDFWPSSSVNARIPPVAETDENGHPVFVMTKKKDGTDGKPKQKFISASAWLDRHKPVEQMTWHPGEEKIIKNTLVSDGGFRRRFGTNSFNLYNPAPQFDGDANNVEPWLAHLYRIYPDDAEHIIQWLAHRAQKPEEKINHALFLGGAPGIGKDTIVEALKFTVGNWNFKDIKPEHLSSDYNWYLRSVVTRISEAHDLGELNRYQFYEHMKTISASPPDVHAINEKYKGNFYIVNVNGVIITSNHKTDGIYLPPDDRRTYVAWSEVLKEDAFKEGSDFSVGDRAQELYGWYDNGGYENVGAFLRSVDISSFNAKAPPPRTEAFWAIANANVSTEENELGDLLEEMGRPDAITVAQIIDFKGGFAGVVEWLQDKKNGRATPHKLSQCGYVSLRCPDEKRGRWRVAGRQTAVYVRSDLSERDKLAAARKLGGGTGYDPCDP